MEIIIKDKYNLLQTIELFNETSFTWNNPIHKITLLNVISHSQIKKSRSLHRVVQKLVQKQDTSWKYIFNVVIIKI